MSSHHAKVRAAITYADVEGNGPLVFRLSDWTGFDKRTVEVTICDARTLPSPPTLEEHGFARVPFEPAVGDQAELERVWPQRVRERLKAITGAAEVVAWGFNARFSGARSTGAPARVVHTDFCPAEFTGELSNDPAKEALRAAGFSDRPRRWRCFNVWQALSKAPHDTPLALCDARSVGPSDVIRARGQLYDAAGSPTVGANFCLVRHNAAHRWIYFPDLRTDEALIFSGLHPGQSAPWHVVPHTAFDDPKGTVPRSSLEIRAVAVYDS